MLYQYQQSTKYSAFKLWYVYDTEFVDIKTTSLTGQINWTHGVMVFYTTLLVKQCPKDLYIPFTSISQINIHFTTQN